MAQDERIRVLPPEVARKIAAGEVVDRPAALIRELVDNAIDAEAKTIEVIVEGGGALKTEVVDDGRGMTREDIELCWLSHATSKIRKEEDLLTAETLGFRGEALAAVSAVARLEITTSQDGREAWKLAVGPGSVGAAAARIEQSRRSRGTTVRAIGLFDSFPARKKFLKRDAAEALLCKQALIDKALAFPEICFRFVQNGDLKLFLPAVSTLRERFIATHLDAREESFVHEIATAGEGFSLSIVVGGPELRRNDRRLQYVVANGRRIQDFALMQALEYGVQGWFPNGSHPVGAIYVDVDPSLADFNIHPAKREVRFKDGGAIHHAATQALRDFMRRRGIIEANPPDKEYVERERGLFPVPERNFQAAEPRSNYAAPRRTETHLPRTGEARLAMEALLDSPPDFAPRPGRIREERAEMTTARKTMADAPLKAEDGVRFIGVAFDLFLVVQRGDRLYLIDQHAAHERLLYDRFKEKSPARQELLVPYPFNTESEEDDAFLASRQEDLSALGIVVERESPGSWKITALPEAWRRGDEETVRAILDLRAAGEDFAERWLATLACKAAAKDGDVMDSGSAATLAAAALELPIPRCPHGRPVWMEITKESLFKAVRRGE